VIIGVALVTQDADAALDVADNDDVISLMARSMREAADDSGSGAALDHLDLVAVVAGLWRHLDPGRLVADELGLDDPSTLLSTFGGQTPIAYMGHLCELIAAGEVDAAAMVGGETTATRHRERADDGQRPRRDEPAEPAPTWGPELDMGDELAITRDGLQPRNTYAILESAVRASRGESLDADRDRVAALWSGYAAVAAENARAADRSNPGPSAIREPGPGNRMVSWPYTKAMCANNQVDHAAAVIVCATEVADLLGVPADRRVYPHLCVTASDTASLLEREDLTEPPGMRAACNTLLAEIGGTASLDHVDLYGCFPSIVAITTDMLGLDPSRRLTQTGGLGFAGAALNNAAGESLVAMVETLRRDPGSRGLVQGNGGHAAKHSLGVFSTTEPDVPHRVIDCGVFPGVRAVAPAEAAGEVWIDGITVTFSHEGPIHAVAICRFDDGSRTWANSDDPDLMQAVMTEEWVGRRARVDGPVLSI
jgi:acetyl-CoA C-acetyltransferase